MKSAINFKSQGAYKKWLAYGHMNGDFAKSPGNTPVKIQGKAHNVIHQRGHTVSKLPYHSKSGMKKA